MIIPLGGDSEEESDSENPSEAKVTSRTGFLGNLDQFLSNVRQDVEKQVSA